MSISKINACLKKAALKRLGVPGYKTTEIAGFYMNRVDDASRREKCFYSPKIILMVQGAKRAVVGGEETVYHENQCLVSGIEVPGTSYVMEASPQKPLITLSVDLDIGAVSQMIAEMPLEKISGSGLCKGLAVADADEGMLGAFLRLAELLDKDGERDVLAPIVIREIYSRVLISPMGRHVREFCTVGTESNRISRAVKWLKENYKKSFQIEDLAKYVNMAPTTFHRRFKKITSTSPIQYQKALRLHEAKRIMIAESAGIAEAAYSVGYESPTQFSREYKRLFGVSPKQDISK